MADEFTPNELDAIEDALEDLESLEDPQQLGLSEPATQALVDYQRVLSMTRAAMPEEVPAEGLLDDVLAQSLDPLPDAEPAAVHAAPWWSKMRGVLLPGAALSAAAAAVFLIVRPGTAVDSAPAFEHDAGPVAVADSPEVVVPERPAEVPVEPARAEELQAEPKVDAVAPPREPAKKRADKAATVAPDPEPLAPPPEPADKDELWDRVESGHAARRRGDCMSARSHYAAVIQSAQDAALRGRARAGLGLCESIEGDPTAEATLDEARAEHPGIAGWIETERARMPAPKRKQQAPAQAAEAYED